MREGLFHEHVLAAVQRHDGGRRVRVGGQADIDGIHVGIGQEGVGVAIDAGVREVHLLARTAEIALDVREVAGERLLVLTAHCNDLHAGDLLVGLQVSAPHEA